MSTLSTLKAMGCPDALFVVDDHSNSNGSNSVDCDGDDDDESMSVAGVAAAAYGAGGGRRKKGANTVHAVRKAVHQHITATAMLTDAKIIDICSAVSGDNSSTGNSSSINRTNMLARTLRSMNAKPVTWRSQRSYLLADPSAVRIEPSTLSPVADPAPATCRVQVGGYLRGKPMPLHSLMHIVGVGAGRVVKVWQGHPPGTRAVVGALTATAGDSATLTASNMSVIFADRNK